MNLNKAMTILKKNGHKTTNRREDILRFFAEEDKYRTAKDLYEHMDGIYPGISFDTVYRNLHLYDDLSILESTDLNAEKHFRMNCSSDHHHHFICKICGQTKKIKLCPMDDVVAMLNGYIIEEHKFEVYGLCPTCQTA